MGSIAVGQGQLLDAPPVRRLIVPQGHSAWWGADLGTTRLALAYVDAEGRRGVHTAPFAALKGAARLSHIYSETRLTVMTLAECGWPPAGALMTEQTSGSSQSVNLPFIMAAGAIHAGLYDGLREAYGHAEIETCVSSHWKLVSCGAGNLYKPKRVKGQPKPALTEYAVFRWARDRGWCPLDWNEADAAGMADCARREIALEER